ncbi:peroxidase 28-like [Senna tora]|uniref:peroxidase n=1 Tax=Senna tora TaxID=362788 RepID=A0A834SKQ9_9FABA|nr:peroxidase 28-like [Senna tora]
MDQMLNLFKKKGFNAEDMTRPENLDPVAVDELKKICKALGSTNVRDNPTVNFDETPAVIDNVLYRKLVEKRNALLETDQAMVNDKRTTSFVRRMAEDLNLFSDGFFRSAYRKPRRG